MARNGTTGSSAVRGTSVLPGASSRPLLSVSLLVATDLIVLALTAAFSVWLRRMLNGDYEFGYYARLWPALWLFPVAYAWFGLYPGVPREGMEEIRRATLATTSVFLTLGALTFTFKADLEWSRGVFLMAWALSLVAVVPARLLLRQTLARRSWWGFPVLVIGSGPTAERLIRNFQRRPGGLQPDHATREIVRAGNPEPGPVPLPDWRL